jgi:magnesium transporter
VRTLSVIEVVLHAGPDGLVTDTSIDDLAEIIAREQTTVWVDVVDPTPEEIARIAEKFGFHPLAVEDVARGGQRPKIDQYDDYQFIVFYGLTVDAERCRSHEVDIFVGKHFMVTFHDSRLPVIAETAARWRAHMAELKSHGPGFLLYSLLDSLVDGYFPVLDDIGDRADALEETIVLHGQPGLQTEILKLRRELLMIRRVAGPERDIMNVLVRRDPPLFGRKEIAYFQDVYDHLLRITDAVDVYRDLLASLLDANLSMISYSLSIGVRRLTSWSIILMSIAIVAGIYGMNFVHMPELDWRLGYPFALGFMAVVALVEVAIFRRIDWL